MGVGLEAGLAIDAMAEELCYLVDQADAASLQGEVDELAHALESLAERLLVVRPFIPDKKNALPATWKVVLKQWVSGAQVSEIGPDNMRVVEDAFTYRLVWALEAIRTRRMTLGQSSEIIPGGGAAALETGVPRLVMAMLIRAGLPSRRAAIAAVQSTNPFYLTPVQMRDWLESDQIAAFTHAGNWPTPDTADLWARFRSQALSTGFEKWSIQRYRRLLETPDPSKLSAGLYRIITDDGDGRTWLATPDYRRLAPFRSPAVDPKPSLFSGRLEGGSSAVYALRIGRGKSEWPSK